MLKIIPNFNVQHRKKKEGRKLQNSILIFKFFSLLQVQFSVSIEKLSNEKETTDNAKII